jgi:HAMP domain-containing protein
VSVIVIVLIVLAACALVAVVALEARRRAQRRAIRRERLAGEVSGHRQEAEAHDSRAGELTARARANREEAARLLAEAERIEERVGRSKRFSARHRDAADDRARKLEEI